jgi:hypothetical protein
MHTNNSAEAAQSLSPSPSEERKDTSEHSSAQAAEVEPRDRRHQTHLSAAGYLEQQRPQQNHNLDALFSSSINLPNYAAVHSATLTFPQKVSTILHMVSCHNVIPRIASS